MPERAKIIDTQNGIKSTDNNNTTPAKILNSIGMNLYYLEASFDASPM